MDSAEQAQAFAALEALQAGRWDRILHRFAGVVKMREQTDEYKATLIVGAEEFCPHGEPWNDRDPCPDIGATPHKFTDREWLAWPRPPRNGGWCQVKGCGLAESAPVHIRLTPHEFVPVKGGPVRNGICFAEGCGRGEFDSVHAVAVETHKYVGGSWPGAKCEWAESAGCSWYPCELPASHPVHGVRRVCPHGVDAGLPCPNQECDGYGIGDLS